MVYLHAKTAEDWSFCRPKNSNGISSSACFDRGHRLSTSIFHELRPILREVVDHHSTQQSAYRHAKQKER